MIVEILKWWMAVGCIFLALVLLSPRAYELANLEDTPLLKSLSTPVLLAMFWAIAMFTALVWPLFLVRALLRRNRP